MPAAPRPIAICIEDMAASPDSIRYTQCTVAPGDAPGLALDRQGALLWRPPELAQLCELWVSADDRLMLMRGAGAAAVTLRRGGRELDLPAAKPVVLMDQDQLELGGRCLRVHVHGEAHELAAPQPLQPEELDAPSLSSRAMAAAAALGLGAAVGLAGVPAVAATRTVDSSQDAAIEVRNKPPKMAPRPRPDAGPKQPPPKQPPKTKKPKKK